jgi:hypothetical protein
MPKRLPPSGGAKPRFEVAKDGLFYLDDNAVVTGFTPSRGGLLLGGGWNSLEGRINTPENKRLVRKLASHGLLVHEIMTLILNPDTKRVLEGHTFDKYFGEDMEWGRCHMKLKVSRAILRQALGAPAEYDEKGNKTRAEQHPYFPAGQWWEKTRSGFKEVTQNEVAVKEGTKVTLIIEG